MSIHGTMFHFLWISFVIQYLNYSNSFLIEQTCLCVWVMGVSGMNVLDIHIILLSSKYYHKLKLVHCGL